MRVRASRVNMGEVRIVDSMAPNKRRAIDPFNIEYMDANVLFKMTISIRRFIEMLFYVSTFYAYRYYVMCFFRFMMNIKAISFAHIYKIG